MRLIDDDEAQMPQHACPALMRAEQGGMNHVRVREDESCVVTDAGTRFGGGIAVVGGGVDVVKRGNALREFQNRAQLVRPQRFRRRDIQRTGGRVLCQGCENRQAVA